MINFQKINQKKIRTSIISSHNGHIMLSCYKQFLADFKKRGGAHFDCIYFMFVTRNF